MSELQPIVIREKIADKLKKILNDLNHFNVKNVCSLHFYVEKDGAVRIAAGFSPNTHIESFIINQVQTGYLENSGDTGGDPFEASIDCLVANWDVPMDIFRAGEERNTQYAFSSTTFIILPKLLKAIREGLVDGVRLYKDENNRNRVDFLTIDSKKLLEVNYDIYGDFLTVLAPSTSVASNNFFRKREIRLELNIEKVTDILGKFKSGELMFEYPVGDQKLLIFKDLFAISKPSFIEAEVRDFSNEEGYDCREVFIHIVYKEVHHYARYVYIKGLL